MKTILRPEKSQLPPSLVWKKQKFIILYLLYLCAFVFSVTVLYMQQHLGTGICTFLHFYFPWKFWLKFIQKVVRTWILTSNKLPFSAFFWLLFFRSLSTKGQISLNNLSTPIILSVYNMIIKCKQVFIPGLPLIWFENRYFCLKINSL